MKLIKKARPDANSVLGSPIKQDLPKAMTAPLVKKVLGTDEVMEFVQLIRVNDGNYKM